MTSFSKHHGLEYVTCSTCKERVKPIIKEVPLAMVGTTNVDFCPLCDAPTGEMTLSDKEIATAEISERPDATGWLDYLGNHE